MIYVQYNGIHIIGCSTTRPTHGSFMSRWDWDSYDEVVEIADRLTDLKGVLYLPVDQGSNCSPRYDVIRAPEIGDEVSYSFNGDTTPDGKIVKITKTLQIKTDTGHAYRRVKNTATWLRTGGTWALVKGHLFERNPHF